MTTKKGNILRLERARKLDRELKEVARERNRLAIRIAAILLEMKEQKLAEALGHESVQGYARKVLGYSASRTRDVLALARKLGELPKLRLAAESGEVPWTKLRTVAVAATKKNEGEWLEKAKKLSSRELEREAAQARGEEVLETITLKVTRQERADIEDGALAILREDPTLGFGAAIAEACRRAALGGGAAAPKADEKGAKTSAASYRIVVTTCGTCWAATRETSEGPVEVDRAELDRAACDSEVLDIREGPKAVTRTIPPKNANFVRARDRGRCRVPGCSNRSFVDIHHEGGRLQVGHDPNKMMILCTSHHRQRHEGKLGIEIAGDEVLFKLADGTPIGGESASREADSEVVRLALTALKNLDFTAREAKEAVARGLATVGAGSGIEELVRAALQAVDTKALVASGID